MVCIKEKNCSGLLIKRIRNLIPVLAAVNCGQQNSRLLCVLVFASSSPGPAVIGVDEVKLVNLFRLIEVWFASIPEKFKLDLARLSLSRPGGAAVGGRED